MMEYSGKEIQMLALVFINNGSHCCYTSMYNNDIRAAVEEYGLWDQLRVDHGREFYLLLFVQEKIRRQFGSSEVVPYMQTRSTEVNCKICIATYTACCYHNKLIAFCPLRPSVCVF